jgi:hypothetical protein
LHHLVTFASFLASPPEVLPFSIEPYMNDWDSRNPDSHSLTTQTSKKTLFIAKSGKTPNSTICTLTLMQQVFVDCMTERQKRIRMRAKRPLVCGVSAPQFVRVPTGKAMALIFLIRKAPNQHTDPSLREAKRYRMKNLGEVISL